jgi:hypothetical protein
VDHHLASVLKDEHDRLEQSAVGVEAETELTVGLVILFIEGFDPLRPVGRLYRVLLPDPMLEGAQVDLHAAK